MPNDNVTDLTRIRSAKALFWVGTATSVLTVVIDVTLMAIFLGGQLHVPQLASTIISRIVTLLTVLGPAMIVGALVVELLERSRRD